MYNGAWDYPADTRGYTWGWVHEFHTKSWSLRYGSAAEPRVANGLRFDRQLFRDRGDNFEGEKRHDFHGHPGAIRLLGFALHTDSGTYADALKLSEQTGERPDVTLTRRPGTLKYGFGVSADQELTKLRSPPSTAWPAAAFPSPEPDGSGPRTRWRLRSP
jgi:hypothetical protein